MTAEKIIQSMLNKPYGANLQGQNNRYVCWHFCKEVYALFGIKLRCVKGLICI